jgi:hypothetical protein
MMQVLAAIEETPLSVWVREDFHAFFYILMAHSLGMALLVGAAGVICLAASGAAPAARVAAMRGFVPVMAAGLALAVISGVLLLWGYPAKALTNPVFALKFAALIAAGILTLRTADGIGLEDQDHRRQARTALIALALWGVGVVAAKLLLYTHTRLMAG